MASCLAGVSFLAWSVPALAVNFGCLLGSASCSGRPSVPEPVTCKACFFSEVDFKGNSIGIDANTGWNRMLGAPPTRSVRFAAKDCKREIDVFLVQGETAEGGAVKVLPAEARNLAAVAPGWSQFTWARVGNDPTVVDRPRATETVLPFYSTGAESGAFARRDHYVAFPYTNPAATRGTPLPQEGFTVAYVGSILPGGCIPVGGRNDLSYQMAANGPKGCQGVLLKVVPNPTKTCQFRTTAGNSTIAVTPYSYLSSVAGGPSFAVSTQPKTLKVDGVLSGYHPGALAWAWYINTGPNPVTVACTP